MSPLKYSTIDKINFLVGDGEQDLGLFTKLIYNMYENDTVYKIDDIVNDMEDSSISLVDLIANFKKTK